MRAYERLLDYVKIHTTSDETTGTHPSFAGEFDLARLLEKQLKELGLTNVHVTDKCYVYGFLPATVGYEDRTPIGFIAHMDTVPGGKGVAHHAALPERDLSAGNQREACRRHDDAHRQFHRGKGRASQRIA